MFTIILWGLSDVFRKSHEAIMGAISRGDIEVKAVIDKAFSKGTRTEDGFLVMDKCTLPDEQFDFLVVTSTKFFWEIRNEALKLGVKNHKIVPGWLFLYPEINIPKYLLNWKNAIVTDEYRIEKKYSEEEFCVDACDSEIIIHFSYFDAGHHVAYIYRYGELIDKVFLSKSKTKFRIDKEGVYRVDLHRVAEIDVTTDSREVDCFSQDTIDVYMERLGVARPTSSGVPFFPRKKPYDDYAVVVGNFPEGIELPQGLKVNQFEENVTLISNYEVKTISDARIYFSGTANLENRFVYGIDDIKADDTVTDYIDRVGAYSMVIMAGSRLEIRNDYFGFETIYYYESENVIICSNRYQLILKILSQTTSLKMNTDVILESLSGNNFGWNTYPVGDRTLWKELKVLGAGKYIEIIDENIQVCDAGLLNMLKRADNEAATEDEYYSLLKEGIIDAKKRVENVINSGRFSKYSIDLTGGMDSRIVFSTLSDIPGLLDKAYIHTLERKSKDFYVPIKIAYDYGLKFDISRWKTEDSGVIRSDSLDDYFDKIISFNMHRRIDPNVLLTNRINNKDMVVFNGGCSESITRHYEPTCLYGKIYPLLYQKKSLQIEADEGVFDSYILINTWCRKKTAQRIVDRIREIRDTLPARTMFKKYEMMWLLQYNRYHFAPNLYGGEMSFGYAVSMSPKWLEALMRTYSTQSWGDQMFDLINMMNPALLRYDFLDENYHSLRDKWAEEKGITIDRIEINDSTEYYDLCKQQYLDDNENTLNDKQLVGMQHCWDGIDDIDKYLKEQCYKLIPQISTFFSKEDKEELFVPIMHMLDGLSDSLSDMERYNIRGLYFKAREILAQIAEMDN